jgi:dimethylamine monooxygenase subunit A
VAWSLFPVDGKPFRLTMGLRSVPESEWILDRPDWVEHVGAKHEVLAQHHDEVFAALPLAEAGSRELLDTLIAHLAKFLPHRVEFVHDDAGAVVEVIDVGSGLRTVLADFHPLDAAARLVPDDLTVQVRDEYEWLLVGASVAFPSRWVLSEKVGKGLDAVHDPVPGYDEALRPAMTGTFDKLRVDRIVERVNWTIPDDPALFQPVPPGRRHQAASSAAVDLTPDEIVAGLYLRIERQTVRVLPESRAAIFTIGTFVDPLADLASDPEALRALAGTLPTVPEVNLAYKGIVHAAPGIQAWAQARLAMLES